MFLDPLLLASLRSASVPLEGVSKYKRRKGRKEDKPRRLQCSILPTLNSRVLVFSFSIVREASIAVVLFFSSLRIRSRFAIVSAMSVKERVIVALENTFETPFLTPI